MTLKSIIVESNFEVLLDMQVPSSKRHKKQLSFFLEPVKSPQYLHTYRLNHTSLWSGFHRGWKDTTLLQFLKKHSRYPLPSKIVRFIKEAYKNHHRVLLSKCNDAFYEVSSKDKNLLRHLCQDKVLSKYLFCKEKTYFIPAGKRGDFKANMVTRYSIPVKDTVGFIEGKVLPIQFKKELYHYRDYQQEAMDSFVKDQDGSLTKVDSSFHKGAGVIVLPCGSGKTIVGIGIICVLQTNTLIITPNTVALRQWLKELLEKTNIASTDIGEYSGDKKQIKPITVSTYQILTYRSQKGAPFKHYHLFDKREWGLMIYDEIHLLPAPVFRTIADLQSKRRLGLTATLIREDRKEKDVFALIGPKLYEVSWKSLEDKRFIASVMCYEVKVKMNRNTTSEYFNTNRSKFRIASENERKLMILEILLKHFQEKHLLIIGQYINQLKIIAKKLGYPLITGVMTNQERQYHYKRFNNGESKKLIVSKVANFAIDLPNAEVAIQISGTYGSRQEEAQRLGRIIRPKKNVHTKAYFFTLTTKHSREEYFARNRKRFLIEQGYHYTTCDDIHLELLLKKL